MIPTNYYLILSAILFGLGVVASFSGATSSPFSCRSN